MRAAPPVAFVFLLMLGCAAGQPVVYPRGIASAATYAPAGLPNGPIARGSIFSVFGSGLGPAAPAQVSQFPLQNTFSGVSVTITQGSTQVDAIPIYASAGQLNVLMPSNAPLGAASLRVTFNGAASNASTVQIANNSFGFFLLSGGGPGAFLNFIDSATQPFNSLLVSAKPGQVVTAYGTGLGPVASDNVAPTPGTLPYPVQVFVGGQSAAVAYSGRSPCCSGLDQIVFTVPANTPSRCWVPVYVVGGGVTSNFATMAINPNGSACSEPSLPGSGGFIKGGKIGTVRLFRSNTHQDIGTRAPVDVTTDHFLYDFALPAADQFAYASLFSQPPAGTCAVLSGSGDLFGGIVAPPTPAKVPGRLDGGVNFTLTGPRGSSSHRRPRRHPCSPNRPLRTQLSSSQSALPRPRLLHAPKHRRRRRPLVLGAPHRRRALQLDQSRSAQRPRSHPGPDPELVRSRRGSNHAHPRRQRGPAHQLQRPVLLHRARRSLQLHRPALRARHRPRHPLECSPE